MDNKFCNKSTKLHILKLHENFCDDVYTGYKNFEVRKNDRCFQRGDIVQFQCVDDNGTPLEHFIHECRYEITYVLSGWGIKEDYVVFGIRKLETEGN